MKKLLILLLITGCLGLCGCGTVDKIGEVDIPPVPTADAAEEEVPQVTVSPETAVTETEHQHIIINVERTELEAYDPQQGTELILSFSYETPYVHIPANAVAEEAINEFIAMLDESYYTGDDYGTVYNSGHAPGYINMLTSAEDNYNYIVNAGVEDASLELVCHRSLSVERCDEAVLSLLYYDYVNLGGVHGSYAYRGYCFDTQSGELVSLEQLSNESGAFMDYLKGYMLDTVNGDAELYKRMEGSIDAEGFPTLEEAIAALLRDGSWYFNGEGLVIFSDLYELSSYAGGIIEFTIPYAGLESYVSEEYIPAPASGEGSFSLVPASQSGEISREIIDMLKVDEEGQGFYLVADGSVRNVRISAVDYTDHFYETAQLWYCSVMKDCALQLVTVIPEGMPELKISYSDAAGEHSLLLSQSGEDGGIILVDENIEAVG